MASQKQIDQAWEKGKPVRGRDSDVWRKDRFGNLIRKPSYGTEGQYGWGLDHKNPESKGGSDRPQNIQPLHWEENRKKSDKYPYKKR
ncbi:HNH endonuclease [candidate division KSB1 bacterium]|nr:HNH endonuclease [candidate division KSB1 bacterium]